MNKKIVIFDIDGTLADNSHRQHFLEGEKKDWKSFFDAMVFDKPVKPIVDLYQSLVDLDKHKIVIFTGRPVNYQHQTVTWLYDHVIGYETWPRLLMRKHGDYRSDSIIKKELLYEFLDSHNLTKNDIAFVIDDRQQVVEMWRSEGIACLQCAEGDF